MANTAFDARAGPDRGRAVITGVSGELHQVGAHVVADVLESDGWDVLPADEPAAHRILQAIDTHLAQVVGISATMLSSLPSVRRLVADLRARGGGVRVILGAAFRAAPDLYREWGADGCAGDLRRGLESFRQYGAAPA